MLGPGTDEHIVVGTRRSLVGRGANIVIAGGVVTGTWSLTGDGVAVYWFAEGGPPPVEGLATEVARPAAIVDLLLRFQVTGAARRAQTQA